MSTQESRTAVPRRKSKTVAKCRPCRVAKKSCSYSSGTRSSGPCDRCVLSDKQCSEPLLVVKPRNLQKLHKEFYNYQSVHPIQSAFDIGKPLRPSISVPVQVGSNAGTCDEKNLKEAMVLLSFHTLLLMAIKELIDLALDFVKPYQRNALREQREDRIPILQEVTENFKNIASNAMDRARSIGNGPLYCRALEGLSTMDAPLFHKNFTWGTDEAALNAVHATIAWFSQHGHGSISYILQVKLLQHEMPLKSEEKKTMPALRKQFSKDLEEIFRLGNISVPSSFLGAQMFTPKILLQSSTFAKEVLYDSRHDYLGRYNFQILHDAGITHKWTPIQSAGFEPRSEVLWSPVRSFRFDVDLSCGPRYTERPVQDISNADRLGRTALHMAVHHGGMGDYLTLSPLWEEGLHRTCLNGFTLLHIAACHGRTEVMQHLLTNRSYFHTLDHLDDLSRTPFWYAARSGQIAMMDMLTPVFDNEYVDVSDFDPFQDDRNGHNALAIAARNGQADILLYLFKLRLRRWQTHPLSTCSDVRNEHLLLAFAVESTNRACVQLVRQHRIWRCGDEVHKKALSYAQNDRRLQNELDDISREDYKPWADLLVC